MMDNIEQCSEVLEEVIDGIKLNYQISKKKKEGVIIRKTPDFDKEGLKIGKHLSFDNYDSIVKEFNDIFNENFSIENKKVFNHNLKFLDLKNSKEGLIQKFKKIFTKSIIYGLYNPNNNQMEIITTNTKDPVNARSTLMHELLHMSARKNDEFSGFGQLVPVNGDAIVIGTGIDEGYTEKLNNEIFSKDDEHITYLDEIFLVSGIENIVGKRKMQELYFNADLRTLIKYLNFYEKDIDVISNLIYQIDSINKKYDNDMYEEAKNTIANIYLKKLDFCKEMNLIDDDEYNKQKFLGVDMYKNYDTYYDPNSRIYLIEDEIIIKDDKNLDHVKLDEAPESLKFNDPKTYHL